MSLRARITLAALVAVALTGAVVGVVLLAAVERDGRNAVDAQLRDRARSLEDVARRPGRPRGPAGRAGLPPLGGAPPGPVGEGFRDRNDGGLLAGTGSFSQVAVRGRLVQEGGDVPSGAPGVPAADGVRTVTIDGTSWRSLTFPADPRGQVRVRVASTLAPVQERVASVRRLVLLLGLAALLVTGLAAWAFVTFALRPLERLREGAGRVSGTADLATALPEDDGPVEVRSLAATLNAMLARLRTSTEAMERALAATRRFAADAGHELRTPLTSMRANVDALARNPDLSAAEQRLLVAEVAAEQDRITHLLGGLQALARGDAADALPREDVEVADLLEAAIYSARRRHGGTRFALADDLVEATVNGWAGGLRLLIDNLLDNAALHGRRGGSVRVGLRRDGATAVVRIDDDGPGIDPQDRSRLLEPFARGTDTTAQGTGLGLAIVAQQVKLHGGTLTLGDSELGGLAVEVLLPSHPTLSASTTPSPTLAPWPAHNDESPALPRGSGSSSPLSPSSSSSSPSSSDGSAPERTQA